MSIDEGRQRVAATFDRKRAIGEIMRAAAELSGGQNRRLIEQRSGEDDPIVFGATNSR